MKNTKVKPMSIYVIELMSQHNKPLGQYWDGLGWTHDPSLGQQFTTSQEAHAAFLQLALHEAGQPIKIGVRYTKLSK